MKKYLTLPTLITAIALSYWNGASSMAETKESAKAGQHPQHLEIEVRKTIQSDYLLYRPDAYSTSDQEWPLMLFLHGAGERGDDVSKVALHGPPKLIAQEQKAFPFVVVSPQCPEQDWWTSDTQVDVLDTLLKDVTSRYRIDQRRIYVTGLSMGGFGSWRLAAAFPHRFAAIAPICGGGDPEDAAAIAHLPIWVFHGAKDPVVPIAKSEEMIAALKEAGSAVEATIYPDAGHDSWTETYNNPELYEWLLSHQRSDP